MFKMKYVSSATNGYLQIRYCCQFHSLLGHQQLEVELSYSTETSGCVKLSSKMYKRRFWRNALHNHLVTLTSCLV